MPAMPDLQLYVFRCVYEHLNILISFGVKFSFAELCCLHMLWLPVAQ